MAAGPGLLERRVRWIERTPEHRPPGAVPLQRALGLLLLPEPQLAASTAAIRSQVAGIPLAAEISDVIAAILLSRFNGCTIPEICAMAGIAIDDFTSSVAYREIYGLGRQEGRQEGRHEIYSLGQQEGRQEGRQVAAASMPLRQLHRRCGLLSTDQLGRIQALPIAELEILAEALLDFKGAADLHAWLAHRQGYRQG